MLTGIRILLVFVIIIVCLYYVWCKLQERKECLLLDSDEYKKAVRDWAKMRESYTGEKWEKLFPFHIFLDKGLVGREICIQRDCAGRIMDFAEELTVSEFIEAVGKVKAFLDYPEFYRED